MKKEDILPLGSIVKIKNLDDKLMIVGVDQLVDGENYNYVAFIHPYGYAGVKKIISFNAHVIEKVYFEGYRDEELEEFYEDIEWSYQRKEKEKEGK